MFVQITTSKVKYLKSCISYSFLFTLFLHTVCAAPNDAIFSGFVEVNDAAGTNSNTKSQSSDNPTAGLSLSSSDSQTYSDPPRSANSNISLSTTSDGSSWATTTGDYSATATDASAVTRSSHSTLPWVREGIGVFTRYDVIERQGSTSGYGVGTDHHLQGWFNDRSLLAYTSYADGSCSAFSKSDSIKEIQAEVLERNTCLTSQPYYDYNGTRFCPNTCFSRQYKSIRSSRGV